MKQFKNGLFRVKIEHEHIPITDENLSSFSEVESLISKLKKKFK